jgi:hypothetical protein
MALTHPTIHLNGSGRDSLVEGWEAAWSAAEAAFEALKRTAPNGRDFYPQGPEALAKAIDEHRDRLRKIQAVQDELQELIQHAMDA